MTDLADRIAALGSEAKQRLLDRLRDRNGVQQPGRLSIKPIPRDRSDFPLSFNQERLWFLDQLAPHKSFYNLVSGQTLAFAMDASVLKRALTELARRHEALRTTIGAVGGEPVQRIASDCEPIVEFTDLSTGPMADRETEAQHRASAFSASPFDLNRGPLWRTLVINLGPSRCLFVFVIHHIIADGWSLGLLLQELGSLYEAFSRNRIVASGAMAGEQPLQYLDYAIWQRSRYAAGELDKDLTFWLRQLDGLPILGLPTDRPRPRIQRFSGDHISLHLPERLVMAARNVAHRHGATLFVVLLSAFTALLHRYTEQDDVPVGVPVANRPRVEWENVVGFFANNLVVRGNVSGNPQFGQLVDRLQSTVVDALDHQDLPFSKLVAALRQTPDLSRNPLFQVSFQLITGVLGKGPTQAAKSSTPGIERATSIFDLAFNLWEADGAVEGLIEFDADLYERSTIERLKAHFLTLLEAAVIAPETTVGALPLLPEVERRLLLDSWNATDVPIEPNLTVHRLVERQAASAPAATAIRQGSVSMTFAELDSNASRLAAGLVQRGVDHGDRVGIRLRPSTDLLIAILGVMKAGAAFVPIDVSMPPLRVAGMLSDCQARLLLVDNAADAMALDVVCPVLSVDEVLAGTTPGASSPDRAVDPEDIAYVLFTSGSTGRPKGVMIPHRAVVNYLLWCLGAYPMTEGSGAPLCSPASSDMSITTLFLPLLAGKTVEFLGNGHPIEELERRISVGDRFTFIKVTPSHLDALRMLSGGRVRPGQTAAFVVGGEQLVGETLSPWHDLAPDIMVFNEYGPTETTVGCCVHAMRAGDCRPGPIPIGRPISNTRLYVLDSRSEPMPIGVPGELYIGGAGVGSGYIGRPDLTAASFVVDPFSDDPRSRLYRTGDRVRWHQDGVLEYLGRMDSQVKIRGYRVEPGEIEAVLRGHEDVADAAVICRGVGEDLNLAAFILPAHGLPSDVGKWSSVLAAYVAQRLPAHMHPASFVPMVSLPLTPSGKVDRRALTTWEIVRDDQTSSDDRPPKDDIEDVIARVFADVLHKSRVGMSDDFFSRLGGHSLLAAKVVTRLRELLGVSLQLGQFFEAPTVERLALSLRSDAAVEAELEIIANAVIQVLDIGETQQGEAFPEANLGKNPETNGDSCS